MQSRKRSVSCDFKIPLKKTSTDDSWRSAVKSYCEKNASPKSSQEKVIRIVPDAKGEYWIDYNNFDWMDECMKKEQFYAFIRNLNAIRFGKMYYISYTCIAILIAVSFGILMYTLRFDPKQMIIGLSITALIASICIVVLERFIEAIESKHLLLYLHECNILYSAVKLKFGTQVIQPDADLIAEGKSILIGATEIYIQKFE
jgi:hypothetical protein